MSIFTVAWRALFEQVQPPSKRNSQTLDLGESLLTTLQTDSNDLDAKNTVVQTEKKYNGVKMVMQASLNEIFGETTFVIETDLNIIRTPYFFNESEILEQNNYFFNEDEQKPFYFFNEAEIPLDAAIIVHVPAGLFASSLDQVKTAAQKIKVAGKSIRYISL